MLLALGRLICGAGPYVTPPRLILPDYLIDPLAVLTRVRAEAQFHDISDKVGAQAES